MENFWEGLKELILKDILEETRNDCIYMYTNIFEQVNNATSDAASQLNVTPQSIFPGVYSIIVDIAQTVFIPIACIILSCILCYECISMLVESNRMREFGPQDVFILFVKMVIGIMLLTHSFEIVNWLFSLGEWAVRKVGETDSSSLAAFDAIEYIKECDNLFMMVGFLVIALFIKLVVAVFSIAIKIAVWLRFAELYMVMVFAPIPFSTFLNKEWGQVGYNYVRKILSLAFQPVLMIVCFAIFQGTLVLPADSGFTGSLFKTFAAMFILLIALFKTRTISDSIFNAH